MRHFCYHTQNKKWLVLAIILFLSAATKAQVDTVVEDTVIENTPDTSAPANENFKDNSTADRLPDTVILRLVPDTIANHLKKDKNFAYANDPDYWVKKPEKETKGFWEYVYDFFSEPGVRPFIYVLLGGALLFAFYKVVVANNLYVFYSRGKQKRANEETAFTEIDDDTLDQKIQQAIATGNHRVATRFLYLKTLQLLNEKGWIHYNARSTNYDYVNYVNRYAISGDFNFLTQVYEYAWYGEFSLTSDQFDLVHIQFQRLFKSIGE